MEDEKPAMDNADTTSVKTEKNQTYNHSMITGSR